MKCTPPSISCQCVKPWFLTALELTVFWFFAASALFSQTVFNGPRDYLTGPSPDSVVVADFNGDGRPDIATASQSSATVSVLLRNSDGTFQPGVSSAAGSSPNSLRPLYVADVNNDGKPDLLVLNTTDQTLAVLLGNGDGTFQTQKVTTIAGSYCCLAVGDFNGDGKVDIASPVLGTTFLCFSGMKMALSSFPCSFLPA